MSGTVALPHQDVSQPPRTALWSTELGEPTSQGQVKRHPNKWVVAGPKYLGYPLLLPQVHEQEAGSETEQPGLEPAPVWDASATGFTGSLTVLWQLRELVWLSAGLPGPVRPVCILEAFSVCQAQGQPRKAQALLSWSSELEVDEEKCRCTCIRKGQWEQRREFSSARED